MEWTNDRIGTLARSLTRSDRKALDTAIAEADDARRILEDAGASAAGRQRARKGLEHGRWLNVRPDPIDFRDCSYEPGLAGLRPCLNPPTELGALSVRDQLWLSSCTGMALAVTIDLLRRLQWQAGGNTDSPPPPVSARMLFEMGRVHDELPDDGLGGSSVRGVLRGFFHNGVCLEVEEDDSALTTPSGQWRFTLEKAKQARSVALGTYQRLKHVLLDYHSALNEVRVLLVSAKVHGGWQPKAGLAADGRIRWTPDEAVTGGHAFAVVGYDRDGFLIRNSWGADWSRWQDAFGQAYEGVAHWSYGDWERNVMDAWVIRLAVPTRHHVRSVGGFFGLHGVPPVRSPVSTPRILVNGHYLHLQDGRFVTAGTFNCDKQSMRETADLLAQTQKYDHLVICFESGLDSLEDMVDRAAILTPFLKEHRIYPLFVWWRKDVLDLASGMLEDRARRLAPRSGGVPQLAARLLETFAREFMQPLWRTFEGEAQRAFVRKEEDAYRGQGWIGLSILLESALRRETPLKIHAVVHGAGAVLFAALCKRMLGELQLTAAGDRTAPFSSVSLLAPISSTALLDLGSKGLWGSNRKANGLEPPVGLYTLSEQDDAADFVGAYSGSFLNLARRVFPIDGQILEDPSAVNEVLGYAGVAKTRGRRRDVRWFAIGGREVASSCRTHVGIATDNAVLRHVLGRILATSKQAIPKEFNLPVLTAIEAKGLKPLG